MNDPEPPPCGADKPKGAVFYVSSNNRVYVDPGHNQMKVPLLVLDEFILDKDVWAAWIVKALNHYKEYERQVESGNKGVNNIEGKL